MDLNGKKILVTGGAGFIGSHVADALVQQGADVVIVDNLSTGRRENLHPTAKFYEMNIASPVIEDILERERPQIIFHFSFFVLVPESLQDPLLDMDAIAGTVRILRKMLTLGGLEKIVFSSSGFVYGNTKHLPATENEPVEYLSPYVIAKHTIENYLKFYNKVFGIPYVVLRSAAIYGPRQVTGAMADYIRKLSSGGQAEIWGDGTKTRDYVYIDDVVHANLLALDVGAGHENPVFNIGTAKETTLNSLYSKIAERLNVKAAPVYHPDRPGEQIRYCLNYDKIQRELGWRPTVDLDTGLSKFVFRKK